MSILDTVRRRYTTKHYDASKHLSDVDVAELLEVLRLAPTSVNAQTTHYFVAGTDEAKASILPAIMPMNHARVTDASHVIVFTVKDPISDEHLTKVLNKEDADGRYGDPGIKADQDTKRRGLIELFAQAPGGSFAWAARQAYIAMGFLLLAAADKGIDSTPIEGMHPEKIDEILGLKAQGLKTVAAVSLGYRAANDANAVRPKSRLDSKDVITIL